MKLPALSKGTAFFAMMTVLFLMTAFPAVTTSNYEVENCAMWCREVFDSVLDPTTYTSCVTECKRQLENRPVM
jgi:hypothetical protein